MKKLTMIFAVVALFTATSAFANTGDKVSKKIQTSFQKSFAGATHVSWEATDDFYFASFEMNGKQLDAAYNDQGELLGYSKKMQLAELPLNISKSLKIDFADYSMANLVTEIEYEGKTFYYVSAISKDQVLKLKCLSDGQIQVEEKVKK